MSKFDFVHLHVHSEYSLLDGVASIKDLVTTCKEYGMSAIALTDHGNLFGIIDFYEKALEVGIKPILGMEAYVSPVPIDKKPDSKSSYYHITLIAKNDQGLKNLYKLSTISYLEGFYSKPRIDKNLLEKYSDGIIVLSGCLKGEIPQYILKNDYDSARKAVEWFRDVFKDDFYLELQDVGIKENIQVNKELLELAKKYEIKVVATNDVHYIKKEDSKIQEILLAIHTKSKLSDPKRFKIETNEIYLKRPEEMYELFKGYEKALLNTLEISEKCNYSIKLDPNNLKLPKVNKNLNLQELAYEGLEKKLGKVDDKYKQRLEMELEVIKKLGFEGYFLIVYDIVHYARSENIPVGPGRGSAAGSLVLYALDITQIDPIKYNLLFERFLNPERVSPPDIDLDFADIKRDKLIDYIIKSYGSNSCAQIITFNTLGPKAAIKDVARIYDYSYTKINELTKYIPQNITSFEEIKQIPEVKQALQNDKKLEEIFYYAEKITKKPRTTSVHAAGLAITDGDITEHVPLALSESSVKKEKVITTQFDKDVLEKLGILKIDLLGVTVLSIIEKTIELIRKRKNPDFDINKIPLDDRKTYEMLWKGYLIGIFQLEASKGMKELVMKMKPDRFEDLIALIALYRPGAIAWAKEYIERKSKGNNIEYDFEELKDILSETYGIIVYQEQVMQIANRLAGFTLGEADILRKAIGKKKKELMDMMKEKFINGAVSRGKDKNKIIKLWETIEKFAEYSFNKSHSAGYALLTYQTAYLKANYTSEFYTAILSLEMLKGQQFYKKAPSIISEAKKFNIKILPPDINKSDYEFKIEDENTIRYGLGGIRGIGINTIEDIIKEREARGPFKSIRDIKTRVKEINRKVLEALIKSGACDSIIKSREAELCGINGDNKNGGLFAKAVENSKKEVEYLKYEVETLGTYITKHPLSPFCNFIERHRNITKIEDLNRNKDKMTMFVAKVLVQIKKNSKKETYAILTVEDLTDAISIIVPPEKYTKYKQIIEGDYFAYKIVAELEDKEDEVPVVILESIEPLNLENIAKRIIFKINLENFDRLDDFINFIKIHSSGNGLEIFIEINENGKSETYVSERYRLNIKTLEEIEQYFEYALE
ncbi:MAG: DNA polymerase III subunit alpha [candidate division WOR-3 bacterium]|nr:DNA polymerase III subunit alpha [candidate division WOR-3 bacterium]MDW8150533.1 DNA polymerase III subunit alpha [candidate division WOR-3 bacterium]